MLGKLAPKLGRPPKKNRANQRKTVMLKCQECGKYFEVPHYDKDKRKFCSRTCGSRNQNRKRMTRRIVTKNCEYCGEEFTRTVARTKKDPRYCCTDCANKNREILKRERLIKQMESEFNELMCDVQ